MTTTLEEQLLPTIRQHDQAEADLRDRVALLEAQNLDLRNRPPVVVSGPRQILVGADPENGLSAWTLAGLNATLDKYGDGAFLRAFGKALQTVVRPSRASRIHWSWAGLTLAQARDHAAVGKALAAAQDDDEIEGIHEGDAKVNKGALTFDELLAIKSALYETVMDLRLDGAIKRVNVTNTITGWAGDPKNTLTKGDLARYMVIPAHILGIDFDGISPSSTAYPDFFDEVGSVAEALARNAGYVGWSVPEFGSPPIAGDNGTKRAPWMRDAILAFERTGCRSVAVYDYMMQRDYRLKAGSPELAAIRELVARGR